MNNLKKGDFLAMKMLRRYKLVEIQSVSPTGRITLEKYVLNPDMGVRGATGRSVPSFYFPTPEILEEIKRGELIEYINGYLKKNMINTFTNSDLQAVADIFAKYK